MDHLDEHLASVSVSHKYDPAIRAAVVIGKKTLNRYYDWTDHSELYWIAMGTYILCLFECADTLPSTTPLPQAYLFSACWLGFRVDHSSEKNCS
jgi:hypothetical protein